MKANTWVNTNNTRQRTVIIYQGN